MYFFTYLDPLHRYTSSSNQEGPRLVTTTSQIHREFSGRGLLLRDGGPPVALRYYMLRSAQPLNARVLAGPHEKQWEWEKAQGFKTLIDEADASEVDVRTK